MAPVAMCRSSSVIFILFVIQFFVGYVTPRKIICPPGKAQFPNPDDRHSFYKCDAGGNPILFPCPAKTWFNPCLEVCDWDTGNYNCGGSGYPSNPGSNGKGNSYNKYISGPIHNGNGNNNNFINVNININGYTTSTPPPADGNRPGDWPIPPSHGGYRPPTNPQTGPTGQTLAPNQACSTYGLLYPNPEDCATYLMCNSMRLTLVRCPPGYFFIPETKKCETKYPNGCKFVGQNVGGTENDVWQYQRSVKG